MAVPQRVSTAAGPMELAYAVASRIPAIDAALTVMAAQNTPDALSVGRLCAQNGFRFEWLPYKKNPNFFNDKGDKTETYTRHFVPYLDPNSQPRTVMPAGSSSRKVPSGFAATGAKVPAR